MNPPPPLRVDVPIRIRVDPLVLVERADELDAAMAAAISRALQKSRQVLFAAGFVNGVRVEQAQITWSGDGLADVDGPIRAAIDDRVAQMIAGQVIAGDLGPVAAGGAGERRRPRRKRVRRLRPWVVLKSMYFEALVGLFLDIIESLDPRRMAADRLLYADMYSDERPVGVWWVQINRDYLMDDLANELIKRATELARMGPRRLLAWGITPYEAQMKRIEALDLRGTMMGRIPSLRARNARRIGSEGGSLLIRHGGWVIFAFMPLPRIELADLVSLGPALWLELSLGEVGFCVDTDAFAKKTGVEWQRFADEFAAERVFLWLQPATVRRRSTFSAAFLLLDRYAAEQTATPDQSDDSRFPTQSLFLLTEALLFALPSVVGNHVRPPSGEVQVEPEDDTHFIPGQRVLYAVTWLDIREVRVGQAIHGPMARHLAKQFVELLSGDPSDREWRSDMRDLLDRFDLLLTDRPPGGTLFEHVLAQLEHTGRFAALFDAVDASGEGGMRHLLLRLTLPTNYISHERVLRFRRELAAHVLGRMEHHYVPGGPGTGEIWLGRDRDQRVAAGQVLGDVDKYRYISTKDLKQLNKNKADALRKALVDERKAISEEVLAGRDQHTYDDLQFSREALGRAVQTVGLSDDDFEEVTIERSMRLLIVAPRDYQGLPDFEIKIEFVQRVQDSGEQWMAVESPPWESRDDFEARLYAWRLGSTSEFYETAGMVIAVVGIAIVAWEAGVVAVLVKAAGGTAAVLVSIGFTELEYILRVIFGDAKLSLRGFLEAALDGYLMALGFRWGAGLGLWGARAIGTASARRVVVGWFAQRLAAGTVGGSTSAVMEKFAHELIGVVLDDGSFSGIDEYVRAARIGALTGVVFEFTLQPAMHALLAQGGSALATAADLARRLRREGWSALRWSAALTEALANMRAAMADVAGDAAAKGWATAVAGRLAQVGQELGGSVLARRVLELSGARFTRQATVGLERFLAAAGARTPERAVALTNIFARHPQETVHFLEVLARLETSAARHLVAGTFGTPAELAALIGRLARYTPAEQRAVLRLLGELGIEAAPPVPTLTPAQVLERQFTTSLRLQAGGLELEAQRLQTRALDLLRRAEVAHVSNPSRAAALRTDADRLAVEARGLRDNAITLRQEAARRTQLTRAAVAPGQARRVVYLDASVIDQIARGNGAAAQALLTLRSAADVRISRWTWIELVERPTHAKTATAQRRIIEDLRIAVDDPIPMAQRVERVLEASPPSGQISFSPRDVQFGISARAGGGEVWSFDSAFAGNPQNAAARFGVRVAPESQLRVSGKPQDFDEARRLLGLKPDLPTPSEAEGALSRLEIHGADPATGSGAQAWIRIRLSQRAIRQDATALERVVRPVFRSRTGNRVVFRVQGGTGATRRSQDLVSVDGYGGVHLHTGGQALNLNFGVFEQAVEFLLTNRRAARLVVFEVEEGWFRALRGPATPERGRPVIPGEPKLREVKGLPRTVDIRRGEDQLQVPSSLLPELEEFIVPRSGRVLEFTP